MTTSARPPRRALWRSLFAVVVAVGIGLLASGPAAAALAFPAHAELRSVTPADGATLAQPPAEIVLVYNEDINPAFVQVALTTGGQPVGLGAPSVVRGTVTVPISDRASIVAGGYRIAYRVVSEDGHPVSGASQFTVASPATPSAAHSSAPPATSAPAATSPATATAAPSSAPVAAGSAMPALAIGGLLVAVAAGGLVGWRWRRRHTQAPHD